MSVLNRELWLNTIEEKLRSNWEILTSIAKNDSASVFKMGVNRKVYVPNAGADPSVTINGTSYPVNKRRRTDTAVEYNVDKFEAEPTVVDRDDALSVSYDKIASVVDSMFGAIGEAVLNTTFKNWTSTGQTTTTFSGDTEIVHVLKAKAELDKQKVPATGRILLLNAVHANELLTSMVTKDSNIAFIDNDGLMILNRPLYGFQVVQLPYVVEFASGTTTPVSFGDLGDDDNIPVSLAYHKDMVSVAKDSVHIFYNEGDATEYGDVMSGQAFMGGKYRRNDLKGVIQIYKV